MNIKNSPFVALALLICVVLVSCIAPSDVGGGASRPTPTLAGLGSAPAAASPPTMAPRQPPDFALPDLPGQTVRLSDLRGQVILVNFWATW